MPRALPRLFNPRSIIFGFIWLFCLPAALLAMSPWVLTDSPEEATKEFLSAMSARDVEGMCEQVVFEADILHGTQCDEEWADAYIGEGGLQFDEEDVRIGEVETVANEATVPVTISDVELSFRLVKRDGHWLVDNMESSTDI